MQPDFINGWWLTTDTHLGPSTGTPSTEQVYNAHKVKNFLVGQCGWSLNAVCGTLGNMQVESYLSPAFIEGTNRWRLPNSAADLSDVPNSVMQNFYREYYNDPNRGYGIGLVQWDGKGITRQKLVGYAENNGWNWYDGDTQMNRFVYEQANNLQFNQITYNGFLYNWSTYPYATNSPEDMAEAWREGYEVGGDETIVQRQTNARYWYDYFITDPPIPPAPFSLPYYVLFGYNKHRRCLKNVKRL